MAFVWAALVAIAATGESAPQSKHAMDSSDPKARTSCVGQYGTAHRSKRFNHVLCMINHYSSPYPNFVHQLFVTPSKHLYVQKSRRLKWQDKEMDVRLDKVEAAEKEHVVHYIVADHTSAAFYAELRTSRTLMSPTEFLARAWACKPHFFFKGMPEHLIVPTAVSSKYPEIESWLSRWGESPRIS